MEDHDAAKNESGVRRLAARVDRAMIRERCTYPKVGYVPPAPPQRDFDWKFEDTFGNQFGRWFYRKAANTPAAEDGWVDVFDREVHQDGFLAGRDFAVSVAADDEGFHVYLVKPPAPAMEIFRQTEKLQIKAMSADERFLLVRSSQGNDWYRPALWVMDLSGQILAQISEVQGVSGVWADAGAWAPKAGDYRVIVLHEATGFAQPAIWYPFEDRLEFKSVDLPGEFGQTAAQFGGVTWDRLGEKLLLRRSFSGRSDLHWMDLATGAIESLQPGDGSIVILDNDEENRAVGVWAGNHAYAKRFCEKDRLPNHLFKPSRPLHRWHFRRIAGVPCFVAGESRSDGPNWTFFYVYGMPGHHIFDGYDPGVVSLLDHGIQVVSVNTRGCSGFGRAWREGSRGKFGAIEITDVERVRAQLVAEGTVDARRTIIGGHSYGGYMTLLAMGKQPSLWAMGVAGAPVGDYAHAYLEASPLIIAVNRGMFGGSVHTHEEAYRKISPLTYVDQVVAPIHISAGKADLLCPPQQILNFVDALRARGGTCELEWFKGGHGPADQEASVAWQTGRLDFLLRHCRALDAKLGAGS